MNCYRCGKPNAYPCAKCQLPICSDSKCAYYISATGGGSYRSCWPCMPEGVVLG